MATTTTINPDKDTYVWKNAPTLNYGTQTTVRLGAIYSHGAATPYNLVMEFDVSGYTDPSSIVSANLTLIHVSDTGAVNNTITVRRLDSVFVESGGDGCTWNKPDDSEATTWEGGEDNAVTNVPDVQFTVGVDSDDTTIDISKFVIDAIQRRSGVLRLVFFMTTAATATGWTKFVSTRHATTGNRPKLEIIVAARKVWSGAVSGNLDTAGNWTGGLPDSNDYAYFVGDQQSITAGSIDVNSIFIGKNFQGNFGTSASSITMGCYKMLYSTPYSEANLIINDGKGYDGIVRINNSNNQTGTVKFSGETEYRIVKTGSAVELSGSDIYQVDCHSAAASFTADGNVAHVNITDGSCRLQDGAVDVTAVNASLLIEKTSALWSGDLDITQSGGYIRLKSEECGDLVMYSGTMTVRGNEGAPIVITTLSVYPEATADLRTKSNTIETTNPVKMYGGRVLLDGNVNAAVS